MKKTTLVILVVKLSGCGLYSGATHSLKSTVNESERSTNESTFKCSSQSRGTDAYGEVLDLLQFFLYGFRVVGKMNKYPHLLFFQARGLTSTEVGKVRRHFQKKRDSGGGDCGQIEKTGCNTYKISFKERDDHERVLLRKFHTVSLPSGELHLTVSQTDLHENPHQPTTRHSQTSTKANTKSLERIFPVDIFLLRFLRDNPEASKVLQRQLSSLGCTVELKLDEKEAVIRGDIDKGSDATFVSAAEKWEIQVDQIFIGLTKSFSSHYVLEPTKVKTLLQDLSFVNDNIKVYLENGFAVIVGEKEAVKGRVEILEKSLPIRKAIPILGKHFKLVEEEFSREMRAHCPGVKIQRGFSMITLEGPDSEVHSGATKLEELIQNVKEKHIKLCTPLVTFIQSSTIISKFEAHFMQSFTNPVLIDVESDVVLSSLSLDALEKAEAALQRDLSVANVKLQGAEAVSPDLDRVKEIMNKAKNEANQGELRVDVSFIPGISGTEVRLVGYSEEVNKLKEVLNDFWMNQVWTHEVLNLPYLELVDCFDKFLNIMGVKQTRVTMKALHFPNPCVDLSGPRCLVQEVRATLSATLASLTSQWLSLNGLGAQRFFQAEGRVSKELVEQNCQVLISEKRGAHSPNVAARVKRTSSQTPTPVSRQQSSIVQRVVVNKTRLEIKLGSLVDEQVNVLVAPMLNKQIHFTTIGKCLLSKTGNEIQSKFDSIAANCTISPGDVVQVDAPPSLGCSKVFFIECSPWDGFRGQSVQALCKGLKKCLDLCVQQHLSSVAFPIIGPGQVLNFPLREAIQALTENIRQFGLSASSGALSSIHVVIKLGYPDSEECFHEVYRHLSSNMNQGGRAIFSSLISDLDDITMTFRGGVKLKLVFGDITKETTDAVVNPTDFKNFQNSGVCKDILTIAGPEVEAELKTARVNRAEVYATQPGFFPCKAILHVCGKRDAGVVAQLVCRIIEKCEVYGFKSVAIPAICAGAGRLDPGVVAGAILCSVKAATSFSSLQCLTEIHLVLIKIDVFLAFKEEAVQMFNPIINRVWVPHLLGPHVQQQQLLSSESTDPSTLCTTSTSQQSVFLILGLCRKSVDDAVTKLKDLYQVQCSTQTFTREQLACLTQEDIKDLIELAETNGLYMQMDQTGQGSLTVTGLNIGVNQVMQKINAAVHGLFRQEMRHKEEEDLYIHVAWCILGHNGNWERLPKTANHNLENNDIAGGIVDAQGIQWSVNLQRMDATRQEIGEYAKLKRLENLPDFTFPLYWDNMAADENFKRFELQPSSPEYQSVNEAFRQTVSLTAIKIERLQNVYLRRAYEVQKKHISDKNRQDSGGEKLLYHGTTHNNCDSIMKTGFNRSFAGQNATKYGRGTYFAVDACYSAQRRYSVPAPDGSQLMFVARVLTGIYTQGRSNMKVPPPHSDQQPDNRYDSVVDVLNNPSMYVVFHDHQAYPDYLITFK